MAFTISMNKSMVDNLIHPCRLMHSTVVLGSSAPKAFFSWPNIFWGKWLGKTFTNMFCTDYGNNNQCQSGSVSHWFIIWLSSITQVWRVRKMILMKYVRAITSAEQPEEKTRIYSYILCTFVSSVEIKIPALPWSFFIHWKNCCLCQLEAELVKPERYYSWNTSIPES